jgi:hypothetical protein
MNFPWIVAIPTNRFNLQTSRQIYRNMSTPIPTICFILYETHIPKKSCEIMCDVFVMFYVNYMQCIVRYFHIFVCSLPRMFINNWCLFTIAIKNQYTIHNLLVNVNNNSITIEFLKMILSFSDVILANLFLSCQAFFLPWYMIPTWVESWCDGRMKNLENLLEEIKNLERNLGRFSS